MRLPGPTRTRTESQLPLTVPTRSTGRAAESLPVPIYRGVMVRPASGLVVGEVSGEYWGESTAGSVGVGVGALIETNLQVSLTY